MFNVDLFDKLGAPKYFNNVPDMALRMYKFSRRNYLNSSCYTVAANGFDHALAVSKERGLQHRQIFYFYQLLPSKVRYSIKAVLEKDDVSIGHEAIQPFLIHSTPEQTETQRKQDITEQIKTFGCFPRGYITVSVRIDKDCYRHDDILGLTIEVSIEFSQLGLNPFTITQEVR
jgi:hypothetical protein